MNLQDLYEKYKDRVEFVSIYVREAHPKDGWWLGGGIVGAALKVAKTKAATDVYDPQTIEGCGGALSDRPEIWGAYFSGRNGRFCVPGLWCVADTSVPYRNRWQGRLCRRDNTVGL